MPAAHEISLNCLIVGDDPSGMFRVQIAGTADVYDLKEAVKQRKADVFRDVDAEDLGLYMVSVAEPYEENLCKVILSHGKPLRGNKELSEVFPEPPLKCHIHIIVDYLTIVCWLRRSTLDASFQISVQANATMSELKHRIREVQPDLRNIADQHIRLYRISGDEDELRESLNKMNDGKPLQGYILGPNFLGVPVLGPSQVAVEFTSSSVGKHVLEAVEEEASDRVKRAKIATESPSTVAQPQSYQKWQRDPKQRIIDHRHLSDPLGSEPSHSTDYLLPISLQYEGFGHFLDIFRGNKDVPGIQHVSSARLISAVDRFAEEMSLIYNDEYARNSRGIIALTDILAARTDNRSWTLNPTTVSSKGASDGIISGPHRAASCVVEFKNGPANITAIPYVQMTSYFAHSVATAVEDPALHLLISYWNFPCLGITIIGHYVTFYAMIYFHDWRVVALTPGLSCIRASGDGDDRIALYKAFTAASVLLAHIQERANKEMARPPPPLHIRGSLRRLPPISSLKSPFSDTHIEFEILAPFPSASAALDRHIYTAKRTGGDHEEEIIIKFTRCYSDELHKFCAKRGRAPALLGFEKLPGGFFGVAMELAQSVSLHDGKRGELGEQLKTLVTAFHDGGLVHGDLRAPNIICNDRGVMVIDFDWGGKLGVASYPDCQLNPQLTEGRDSTDLKITKDDDIRVLNKTLKYLEWE